MSEKSGRKIPTDRPTTPLEFKQKYPELNIIQSSSINDLADYIKKNNPQKILVLTGAGVSTAAGIPDFRSPGSGLYDNLAKYNLPYPEAIFTLDYFKIYPEPFFTLARELFPGSYMPTTSHFFIKLLHEKNLLTRCWTQNIDTLESLTGLPFDKVVEAHGSFKGATCVGSAKKVTKDRESLIESLAAKLGSMTLDIDPDTELPDDYEDLPGCGKTFVTEYVKEKVFNGETPKCDECDGLIKPDIVFFGESLPKRFHDLIGKDFRNADLLIVMGTSLQVAPFSNLIDMVGEKVPRLFINREACADYGHPKKGFDFDGSSQKYRRDALYLGTCDEGCMELAKLLGWEDDFKRLIKEGQEQFDQNKKDTTKTTSTVNKVAKPEKEVAKGPSKDISIDGKEVTIKDTTIGGKEPSSTTDSEKKDIKTVATEEKGNDKQPNAQEST